MDAAGKLEPVVAAEGPAEKPAQHAALGETVRSQAVRLHSKEAVEPLASIPKVIHWTFKTDPTKTGWPNTIWKESHQAWLKYFPETEFEYLFWDDAQLSEFFHKNCAEDFSQETFDKLGNEIMRADLGRYCVLKEFGGIYKDLDYEPRMNFYDDFVPGKISLIGSPYHEEKFQNSLMASPTGPEFKAFWQGALNTAEQKIDEWTKAHPQEPIGSVDSAKIVEHSGPKLLDACVGDMCQEKLVNLLGCEKFQLPTHFDSKGLGACKQYLTPQNIFNVKGVHWSTWSWPHLDKVGMGKVLSDETLKLFKAIHLEAYQD